MMPRVPTRAWARAESLVLDEASAYDKNTRWVLNCRHGRMLIHDRWRCYGHGPSIIRFSVWDPITRDMKHLMVRAQSHYSYTAAVLCSIDGCDHLGCHGGPFSVVLVYRHIVNEEYYYGACARVYSSKTDAWSAASTSVAVQFSVHGIPSLLIGDAPYFTSNRQRGAPSVLKYDMASHVLSMIHTLGVPFGAVAMKGHDGGLGFVAMSGDSLYLISQQATGGWARHRTIELETITLPSKYLGQLFGYVDGTDTIFIITNAGLFTLNHVSRQVRKVADIDGRFGMVPYTSFFTPDLSKGRPSLP